MTLSHLSSPYYLLKEEALRQNLSLIRAVSERAGVEIILAFKAYALWRTFPIFREYISSSTASSVWEARLGYEELGGSVHTYTPAVSEQNIADLLRFSSHLTLNSPGQWERFGPKSSYGSEAVSYGLRIHPGYSPVATEIYNPAMPGTRFGVGADRLRTMYESGALDGLDGLHVHALCEGNVDQLEALLERIEYSFGFLLDELKWINLGGGHLITHADYNIEQLIELLRAFRDRHSGVQVILEPGSAFAWQTGYLHSTVIDIVENDGIQTAVLDVSFSCHMPDCLEMPYFPRIRGAKHYDSLVGGSDGYYYRMGGNSCLSGDYMGYWRFEKPLSVGDAVILEDMLHYTTVKTTMFNGVQHPSIALQRLDGSVELLRNFVYEDYKLRMD